MKYVLILICFFPLLLSYSQECQKMIDTTYHLNGRINAIFEFDKLSHEYCGSYKEFDSTGVLIVEGNYLKVDSAECKDCYEASSFNFRRSSKQIKHEYVDVGMLMVGNWRYYHPNGQLNMEGTYSNKVHSVRGHVETLKVDDPNLPVIVNWMSSGPINVWISYDYLKSGIWKYYDENGKKIKEEEYIDGSLIYLLEYQ